MSESDDDTIDRDELAADVLDQLDHGTVIGDKLVISRRAAIAVLVGSTTLTAALGYGSGEAAAQAAGQVGTDSNPVDVEAYTVVADNTMTESGNDVVSSPDSDYEIQKNGTDGSGVINFKTQ